MLNDIQVSQMESSDNSQNPISSNIIKQHPSSTSQYSSQLDLLPRQRTVHTNFGSQQLLPLDVKQFSQAVVQTSIPVSLGTCPLAFEMKRSMDEVLPTQGQNPMTVYRGLQQFQPTGKLLQGLEPLSRIRNSAPVNVGETLSPTSNKMQARLELAPKFRTTSPKIAGSNQLPSIRKRPAETVPPVKVHAEFESVRSKLRESLASALTTGFMQQNKPKSLENNSISEENNSLNMVEDSYQQNEILPSATDSLCESLLNCSTANTQAKKCNGDQGLPIDVSSHVNMGDQKEVIDNINVQDGQPTPDTLVDEVPSSSHSVLEDELLQGHGLSWASDFHSVNADAVLNSDIKRPKLICVEEIRDTKNKSLQISEKLAIQIEAELFKLFGGVNKKYKEKGRSLLFNLKDPSNPELRERVLSGDLPPERLCSMTAEELASKELSQWRQAKAEELAQMVVLPDTDIDIRRVVKKTHKGEFQVEVDQDDDAHIEVGVGSDVLSKMSVKTNEIYHTQPKSNDKVLTLSRTNGIKMSEGLLRVEKSDADGCTVSGAADPRLPEKTDYMQDFMVEEFKDTELLPPVVSLDEFMEALDSEPPFENLEINTSQVNPSSVGRNLDISMPDNHHQLDNSRHKLDSAPDISRSKLTLENRLDSQLLSGDVHKEHAKGSYTKNSGHVDNNKYQKCQDELEANIAKVKQVPSIVDSVSDCKNIWEGLLQLNVSALSNVVSFFLSGEKTSMQEWPGLLEVKGRVRLDAFEKFLQELPLSRSRAIMVVEFRWKEGSQEIGQVHLSEAINSYISDERLGFAEPAPGVELYLCPRHPKITGILLKHLAGDHIENVNSVVSGLIGIIVWRRPHVNLSPKVSSHHKHGSSKKHLSSRKHHQATQPSNPNHRQSVPNSNTMPRPDEEDDVPPGFGPPIVRDEDDLPEFDFARGSHSLCATAVPSQNSGMGGGGRAAPSLSGPSEHMRELVQKYGQGENNVRNFGIPVQRWNDDDIPEWKPNQNMKLMPQPPSVPLPQLHVYQQQQQNTQPFLINQHMMHPQQHMLPPNPQFIQSPRHPPFQPQAAGMQAMPLHDLLQPPAATWWPAAHRAPTDAGVPLGGLHQPCIFGGQPTVGQPQGIMQGLVHGFGGVPNELGGTWRPDNSGSRSF